MSIDSQHQASEVFDQPADEPELRSQVLNNMLNVSTYLVSVLDPNELLTSLARRVVEVVPAVQVGLLWLGDQQQGAIQIKSLHGLDPVPDPALLERLRLRLGEGLAGTVWQRGEPMLIEGRGRYHELAGRVGALAQPDIRRLIEQLPRDVTGVLLPLRIGKQVIGVLELLNMGDGPPLHRQDLQVLQTFGNLAAGAINNAQLHAQMQAHQIRLEALGAVSTVVSMAADLEELMSNALDVILRVIEAPAGMLLLHDLSRSLLSVATHRGLPEAFV